MGNKPCQFDHCQGATRPGWRYCTRHIQVMYRRMLENGYLEPWPGGQEPGAPQDLADWKKAKADEREASHAGRAS